MGSLRWMIIFLLFALYFVIAAAGKGAAMFAFLTFICGVQAQANYEEWKNRNE